jgi:hypothetical protein
LDTNAASRAHGAPLVPTNRNAVADSTLVGPAQAVQQPPGAGRKRNEHKDDAKVRRDPRRRDEDDHAPPLTDEKSGGPGHDDSCSSSGEPTFSATSRPHDGRESQPSGTGAHTPLVLQAVDPNTGQVYWQAAFDDQAAADLRTPSEESDEHALAGLLGTRAYKDYDEDIEKRPRIERTA